MLWGIVIIGSIILITIIMYNELIKLKNLGNEAFATMDVYLKKRTDLIPNLVSIVKGYASHEKETFERIVVARNQTFSSTSIEERQASENALSGTLKSLFALSENYPDLKANAQFLELQQQLQKTEEDIANSRKYYNAVVKKMNTKVETIPFNLVAMVGGFKPMSYFVIEIEERNGVTVEF